MNTALIVLAAVAAAAQTPEYTEAQLNAKYYYDLGPPEIDVSGYPQDKQEAYGLLSRTCSQCHSLARPLNSPLTERKDWLRFVKRMHLRARGSGKEAAATREEAKALVDFLAFDSGERKVKAKETFQARQAELKALFSQIQKDKRKIRAERDHKKARPAPPYTGVK